MGANISTSSGKEGSTVKLACPKGHIMKGSKIKYGKLDNNALHKDYNLPKKCINKKSCTFEIGKNTIKSDPAPGLDKQFEVTLACFDPPYVPGLKAVLKKNIHGKKHWKKKMQKKIVNINGETKVIKVQTEEQSKPIVILPPTAKVASPKKPFSFLTNKYILLGIVAIVILWFLIMKKYKIMKGGAKYNH